LVIGAAQRVVRLPGSPGLVRICWQYAVVVVWFSHLVIDSVVRWSMKALRSGHIASSCPSKTDVPVPGRWQRDGDGVIDRCYPYVPPLRPRV